MARYLKILKADIANYLGFRVSIWLSGCRRHCPGCFNQASWSFDAGRKFDEKALKKIEKELKHDWCRGTSILGGEPLEPENLETVKQIARLTKTYGKDVALWTGYTLESLDDPQMNALKEVDYIVDGPFIESQKDISLKWRGSKNQRIWKRMPLGFFIDITQEIDDGHKEDIESNRS